MLIALDPLPAVVEAACQNQVQLLVTHHPLVFTPLKRLDLATPVGAILEKAMLKRLAIFCAHTNFDKASQGINTALAEKLGLKGLVPLIPQAGAAAAPRGEGMGRLGRLGRPLKLCQLAMKVKDRLGLSAVKMAGQPDLVVQRVAVCAGSGSSMIKDFLFSDAQVLISGDLRYHDARTVEAVDRALIDIGHFASERLAIDLLKTRLDRIFEQMGIGVDVQACHIEKDPFVTA
jgi:dinuclear metal center YbgI/SA1388 family protein